MSYIVIDEGRAEHRCDEPPDVKDFNPGAIIKCDGCLRKYRKNKVDGVYTWQHYSEPRISVDARDPY